MTSFLYCRSPFTARLEHYKMRTLLFYTYTHKHTLHWRTICFAFSTTQTFIDNLMLQASSQNVGNNIFVEAFVMFRQIQLKVQFSSKNIYECSQWHTLRRQLQINVASSMKYVSFFHWFELWLCAVNRSYCFMMK